MFFSVVIHIQGPELNSIPQMGYDQQKLQQNQFPCQSVCGLPINISIFTSLKAHQDTSTVKEKKKTAKNL